MLSSSFERAYTISFHLYFFCNLNEARMPVTNSWPFNSFLASKRDAKNSELPGKMCAIFYSLLFTRALFFCWFFCTLQLWSRRLSPYILLWNTVHIIFLLLFPSSIWNIFLFGIGVSVLRLHLLRFSTNGIPSHNSIVKRV